MKLMNIFDLSRNIIGFKSIQVFNKKRNLEEILTEEIDIDTRKEILFNITRNIYYSIRFSIEHLKTIKILLEEENFSETCIDEIRTILNKITDYSNIFNEIIKKGEFISDSTINSIKIFEKEIIYVENSFKFTEERIEREISDLIILKIKPKGRLNPELLIKGPKEFFQERTWVKLHESEKLDMSDAVQCLLVNNFTPSGMISMRAFESCIKNFYKKEFNKEPPLNLNKVIEELDENKSISVQLKGYLHYLRNTRNSLDHPGRHLTEREAEKIFLDTVEVFELIVN